MSMEEQRQRQEEEARRAAVASAAEAGVSSPTADGEKRRIVFKGDLLCSFLQDVI